MKKKILFIPMFLFVLFLAFSCGQNKDEDKFAKLDSSLVSQYAQKSAYNFKLEVRFEEGGKTTIEKYAYDGLNISYEYEADSVKYTDYLIFNSTDNSYDYYYEDNKKYISLNSVANAEDFNNNNFINQIDLSCLASAKFYLSTSGGFVCENATQLMGTLYGTCDGESYTEAIVYFLGTDLGKIVINGTYNGTNFSYSFIFTDIGNTDVEAPKNNGGNTGTGDDDNTGTGDGDNTGTGDNTPDSTKYTLKYSGNTTTKMVAGNNAKTLGLDETIFNVTSTEHTNDYGTFYAGLGKDGDLRISTDQEVTVTSTLKIKSITVTTNKYTEAAYTIVVDGQEVTSSNGSYIVEANAFTIKNNATDGQVRLDQVEIIVYGGNGSSIDDGGNTGTGDDSGNENPPIEEAEGTKFIMQFPGADQTTNMIDGNNAQTVGLDATKFNVTSTSYSYQGQDSSGSVYAGLANTGEIRIYKGQEVTVSSSYTIKQIQITYHANSTNEATILVNGSAVNGANGVYNINATSFVIKNALSSGQVKIDSIVIICDVQQ